MEGRTTDPNELTISPKLAALLERAEKGDNTALPALRLALNHQPRLWRVCGDLGAQAKEAWLRLTVGENLLLREALVRQMADLQARLCRPNAGTVEALLAERATLAWLQAHHADLICTQLKAPGTPLAVLKAAQARLATTQRLYLATLKQLTTLQRLVPEASSSEKTQDSQTRSARRSRHL